MLAHIAMLSDLPIDKTPLYYTGSKAQVDVEQSTHVEAPMFVVKAIMKTSSGNRALLDSGAYSVGDELEETGWLITDIDADSRSVTIEDPASAMTATRVVPGFNPNR